jgi:sugar/nucleoside kinase (ribokinase family)
MIHGIFIGISTIDVVYRVAAFPAANTKIAADSQEIFAGGPATNAAIAFQHLGGHATLISVLGRHALTSAITAELVQYGVTHRDLAPQHEAAPLIASITVNAAGQRNVISAWPSRITPPAANPPIANIDESLLADASIVLVDGHSMQAAQLWAAAAHARNIPVVLDAGSWKPGTRELLASIDTAICSADFHPPGCTSEDDVIHYLQDSAVSRIAITHGPDPIRFVQRGATGPEATTGLIPVPPIRAVDTMGAGDIFHGAYCFYAATGLSFQQSLHQAAAIAAASCAHPGPRAWMQT